jgi:hypothetical protein
LTHETALLIVIFLIRFLKQLIHYLIIHLLHVHSHILKVITDHVLNIHKERVLLVPLEELKEERLGLLITKEQHSDAQDYRLMLDIPVVQNMLLTNQISQCGNDVQ